MIRNYYRTGYRHGLKGLAYMPPCDPRDAIAYRDGFICGINRRSWLIAD
jgi:hypothetical protein